MKTTHAVTAAAGTQTYPSEIIQRQHHRKDTRFPHQYASKRPLIVPTHTRTRRRLERNGINTTNSYTRNITVPDTIRSRATRRGRTRFAPVPTANRTEVYCLYQVSQQSIFLKNSKVLIRGGSVTTRNTATP